MQEHALFIRLGLPCDATELIKRAKGLEDLFAQLRAVADETPRDAKRYRLAQLLKFTERFETLRLQAGDLESMIVPCSFENYLLPEKFLARKMLPADFGDGLPNAFLIYWLERFNQEVIMATKDIKKFKATAKKTNC